MRKTPIILFLLLLTAACSHIPSAKWTEGATDSDGHAMHTLVLSNVTGGSRVWFQELFDGKTFVEGPKMNHYQGTSWYIDIPPRHSWAPEGFILQQKGKPDTPMKVSYHFMEQSETADSLDGFVCQYEAQPADIIPQVKRVQYGSEPMEESENHPVGWYRITIGSDGEPKI